MNSLPDETRVKYSSKSTRERVAFLKTIPAKTVTKEKKPKVELIDESQATNHLNHGYKLLAVMPSGKLLIEYVGE